MPQADNRIPQRISMPDNISKKNILIVSADTPFLNLIRDNLCLQGLQTRVPRRKWTLSAISKPSRQPQRS